MEPTALARMALILVDHAGDLGVKAEEILEVLGLPPRDEVDPDARVAFSRFESAWRLVISRNPDPALGLHFGSLFTVRKWGLVGYTMAYSRTLGCALQRLGRYTHIMNEALHGELTVVDEVATLRIGGSRRFDALRHPVVGRLSAVLTAIREIAGDDIVPLRVGFSFERPEDTSEYVAFFRCPLSFDRPTAKLVLRRGDLDRIVSTADDTLVGYLERLADESLESLGTEESILKKVRRALWTELSEGQPSVKRISAALNMSVRTLQRRLREDETSFVEVLDEFRREMATGLLRNRELAIYEVAFLLGYSEPSTFHRAFRRWHDCSPREYRIAASSA